MSKSDLVYLNFTLIAYHLHSNAFLGDILMALTYVFQNQTNTPQSFPKILVN